MQKRKSEGGRGGVMWGSPTKAIKVTSGTNGVRANQENRIVKAIKVNTLGEVKDCG